MRAQIGARRLPGRSPTPHFHPSPPRRPTRASESSSFSDNGYTLASGAADGARVWDLRKLAEARSLALPGGAGCSAVAFDATGLLLAAGSAAGAVLVFDAKAAGMAAAQGEAPLAPLRALGGGASAQVSGLAWGARARSLAVAYADQRDILVHRVA